MMKGKKFLPVLVLVLLVALGAMGVVYAAWTEILTVDGTATTGTFDVRWSTVAVSEVDPLSAGTCGAWLESLGELNSDVRIAIVGAYPNYECNVWAKVYNNGSVPAKWDGVTPGIFGSGSVPAWLVYSGSNILEDQIPASAESANYIMQLNLKANDDTPEGENIGLGLWAALNFKTP